MASWEIVVCDGVLASLLRQMVTNSAPYVQAAADAWNPGVVHICTIADIENFRLASPMWRRMVDSTPEWAALRLARWDFANEAGVPWLPYEEYEVNHMRRNWDVFGFTWHMATPISSRRLRLAPVGSLFCSELDQLRTLL